MESTTELPENGIQESVNYLLSPANVVFRSYIFWCSILVVKMLFLSPYTGYKRFKTGSYINPEDLPKNAKMELRTDDPQVERVRRAHRNDLENILPFFTIGLFYVLSDPDPKIAINLFRVVGISRIAHTIIYAIFAIRQPARAIAFLTCFGVTIFMAVKSVISFW